MDNKRRFHSNQFKRRHINLILQLWMFQFWLRQNKHVPPCPSQWMQLSVDSKMQTRKEHWGRNWEYRVQIIWQWICISLFFLYFSAYIKRQYTSQNYAEWRQKDLQANPFSLWSTGPGSLQRVKEIPCYFFFLFSSSLIMGHAQQCRDTKSPVF